MALTLDEARDLMEREKYLVFDRRRMWQPLDNREGRVEKHCFEARIAVAGALPRGVWFRAICWPRFLYRGTFQLECDQPNKRTHHVLYRLEWRPLLAHTNPYKGPSELHGMHFLAGETHHHSCMDHALGEQNRILSGDVGCARPISPDFQKFDEALGYACDRLNIRNGAEIPKPGDQGALF